MEVTITALTAAEILVAFRRFGICWMQEEYFEGHDLDDFRNVLSLLLGESVAAEFSGCYNRLLDAERDSYLGSGQGML